LELGEDIFEIEDTIEDIIEDIWNWRYIWNWSYIWN